MKIQITKGTLVETDEYSDEDLYKLHSYYYQQGLKDIAGKFAEEIESRKNPIKPEKKKKDA